MSCLVRLVLGGGECAPLFPACEERTPRGKVTHAAAGVPVSARALREVSEPEPPEGRSSARRGVFAARAADCPPESDAVSVTACNSLPLNAAESPPLPSVAFSLPASLPVSRSPSDKAGPRSAGHRSGLKLLGKSVPVVVVEFAPPWGIVAEIAPSREWSG